MIVKFRNAIFAILLIALFATAFSELYKKGTHFPYGDSLEYILMTESFYNHFSPDLRQVDIQSYVDYLEGHQIKIKKYGEYSHLLENIEQNIEGRSGFYRTEDGNYISYHFWLYSLANLPARALLGALDADIRATFLLTNLFLLFLGALLISRLKEIKFGHRVVLSFLLLLSPSVWYVDWAHAEVWGGALTFLGVVFYYVKRRFSSLLFFSLAAVHYPPLFIPALIVFIDILYHRGFKFKVLLKLFFSSFWIILPPVFYLYHFGEPSLIASSSLLSMEVVDLRRLYGFFFNLDQGMILAIPLLLLIMIAFFIRDLIRQQFNRMYLMLLSIFLMSLFFMQMTNWSHGHAVVNRYVVWTASIVMVVFYTRLAALKNVWFYTICTVVIITQVFAVFWQQNFTTVDWHAGRFNKLSKFVMNSYPSLYNPDPLVFITRNSPHELSTTDSVRVYTNDEDIIVKMLVENGSISQLEKRGVAKEKVDSLDKTLNYYHGYAYINKRELDAIGYDQDRDSYIEVIESKKEESIKEDIREKILNSREWYRSIQQQAEEWGVPLDTALQKNIDYTYQLGVEEQE